MFLIAVLLSSFRFVNHKTLGMRHRSPDRESRNPALPMQWEHRERNNLMQLFWNPYFNKQATRLWIIWKKILPSLPSTVEGLNFIFIDVITYNSYFLYSKTSPKIFEVFATWPDCCIFKERACPCHLFMQWGSLIPQTYKNAWESATSRASSFLIKTSFLC